MQHTAYPVADELIELRGLRFHYRDWPSRKPGAPDLVLLHGYTGHARSWDAFAEAMTDRYRVIALDQRGHGESAWSGESAYPIEAMTEDLIAFVKAMGLGGLTRFSLVGLSMGGMVAMDYAGRRPAELAALVIVDIAPVVETGGARRIAADRKASDLFDSREAAFAGGGGGGGGADPCLPEAHHSSPGGHTSLMSHRRTGCLDPRRYDRVLRDPANLKVRKAEDGWTSCAAIAVPTLLIRGGQSDILSAEVAARLVGTVPGARFALIEESGHAVPLDAPEAFLAAAREFLTG